MLLRFSSEQIGSVLAHAILLYDSDASTLADQKVQGSSPAVGPLSQALNPLCFRGLYPS